MNANAKQKNFSEDFREPQTIAECQDRLFVLRQDIYKIKQQINDPNRREKMDISEEEYGVWRHRATHARNAKMIQQTILHGWNQSQKVKRAIDAISGNNPTAVIEQLLNIIFTLQKNHNINLSDEMSDIMSLADNIISNEPAGR